MLLGMYLHIVFNSAMVCNDAIYFNIFKSHGLLSLDHMCGLGSVYRFNHNSSVLKTIQVCHLKPIKQIR